MVLVVVALELTGAGHTRGSHLRRSACEVAQHSFNCRACAAASLEIAAKAS
jgi:hypothetical protein